MTVPEREPGSVNSQRVTAWAGTVITSTCAAAEERCVKLKDLYDAMQRELRVQRKMLGQLRAAKCCAEDGTLYIRTRGGRVDCYALSTVEGRRLQINITKDPSRIETLAEKSAAQRLILFCEQNIELLERMMKHMDRRDPQDIIAEMPAQVQRILKNRRLRLRAEQNQADYEKCPKDPRKHIHETCYGEMVRSKSEVIIANALYTYGIIFHYEEKFPYCDEDGRTYYPDFTIYLPDGRTLIWEHFGMLRNLDYCIENAYRLRAYQMNDRIIGENLILTQDDSRGRINSAHIYKIIEEKILPFYEHE